MTELLLKVFVKDYKNVNDPLVRKKYGFLSSIVGIAVNFILSLIKLLLGILTASVAIMADALNNLSDAGSSVVTLVSFKMAAKPADRDHPFGHARIEYIASLIVSFLILLVGFETLTNSISVIFSNDEKSKSSFSTVSIIILASTIIFKLWLAFFYRNVGKKIDSTVIRASSIDSLGDCISTTAVLISAVVVKFTNFHLIDSIVGVAVSIVIIVAGIKLLNETKNSLLGEAPVQEEIGKIKKIIEEYPEIIGVHDLLLHNYGPHNYIASLHAEVDGKNDIFALHDTIDNIEKRIQDELNVLCTIHMDPIDTNNEVVNELKNFLMETIRESIDETLSVHDFRVVVGKTHTNMIFDVVLPFESKYSPKEIEEEIDQAVKQKRANCYCVITVDRG